MQYTQHLTLDVFEQEQFQYIHAKQFDHCARQLVITPTANGEPLTIPETATAVFRCLKHDGTSVVNPTVLDAAAGTITFELTDQALACEGMARADVSITDGEEIISTLTFYILVDKAAISNEQIVSTNEFLFIVQAAAEVEANAQAAVEAARSAAASAAAAEVARKTAEDAIVGVDAAIDAAEEAKRAKAGAELAATKAGNSAGAADASEKKAAASETAAGKSATDAGNSAAAAGKSATNAAASEQTAKEAASTAESKARESKDAAGEALASKNAAETAEINAVNSANSALATLETATAVLEEAVEKNETIDSKIEAQQEQIDSEEYKQSIAKKVPYVKVVESPDFVDSIAQMTDTSKKYVLKSEGMVYAYETRKVTAEGGTTPNFTNLMDDANAYVKTGSRYSLSGGAFKDYLDGDSVIVPFAHSGGESKIRVRGASDDAGYNYVYFGATNSAFTMSMTATMSTESNGDIVWTISNSSVINGYITFTVVAGVDVNSLIVTKDEEITYTVTEGGTEIVTEWMSTGINYNQPADYENRVIVNENNIAELKNETAMLNNRLNGLNINAGGTTVFSTPAYAPIPQLPADGSEGSDFNIFTVTANELYSYMRDLISKYPNYITEQVMGKDASNTLDHCRYILCKSFYHAWVKATHPRMFAWINGSAVIYSVSVSPRVGDTMYSTPYIGTSHGTVTTVNCTTAGVESSRTVGGKIFTRYKTGDIEPTIVYTKARYEENGNTVYNSSFASLTTISALTGGILTGADGNTYNRYPFEDKKHDKTGYVSIFMLANEHGGDAWGDALEPSIVCARLANDLCKNTENPFIKWLKENAMITMIPTGNPYGYGRRGNEQPYGYYNANGVNLNRNYDTAGWVLGELNYGGTLGDYAGSENETQHIMNTMWLCNPNVGISIHSFTYQDGQTAPPNDGVGQFQGCGFKRSRMDEISEVMISNYNIKMEGDTSLSQNYLNCGKSPAYIQYVGAVGGLIEVIGWNANDWTKRHDAVSMEQAYTEVLLFLQAWCEEALEQ